MTLSAALLELLRKPFKRPDTRLAKKFGLHDYQIYPTGHRLNSHQIIAGPHRSFSVTRSLPIASMGSCFAREIKFALLSHGYRYVQTEQNQWSEHSSCAWERVYSIRNALQILEYSKSQVVDERRLRQVGHEWRDIWRNRVAYSSREAGLIDLKGHVAASRAALQEAQLFIFTLGQNETWWDEQTKSWLAQKPPPGVKATLQQGTVDETVAALRSFYQIYKAINPTGTLLLTLSPVPSLATFYDANVIGRSFLNKSILRVALDEFIREHSEVLYFPSFEIVFFSRRYPFKRDNVHVKPIVVSQIMKAFFERYGVTDDLSTRN